VFSLPLHTTYFFLLFPWKLVKKIFPPNAFMYSHFLTLKKDELNPVKKILLLISGKSTQLGELFFSSNDNNK